jgi:hypothetical protein
MFSLGSTLHGISNQKLFWNFQFHQAKQTKKQTNIILNQSKIPTKTTCNNTNKTQLHHLLLTHSYAKQKYDHVRK